MPAVAPPASAACVYRAAGWRHEEVERAAYRLLQELDAATA